MTELLIFCLVGGCWLPIGWAVDHYDLYPEHWLTTAYAGLLTLLAYLMESHR